MALLRSARLLRRNHGNMNNGSTEIPCFWAPQAFLSGDIQE